MTAVEETEGRNGALPPWVGRLGRLLVTLVITLVGLLFVTFLIGRVVPIDPVLAAVGDRASESTYHKVYLELGLDKPLWQQFLIYVNNVLHGNLGESVLTNRPVLDDIADTFPATLELSTFAILIGTCVGVPLGVWAAVRQESGDLRSTVKPTWTMRFLRRGAIPGATKRVQRQEVNRGQAP